MKNKDNFEKKFKNTFLPYRLSTQEDNIKEMKWYIETINNKMNIINILNILEGYNKLKGLVLNKENINKINTITGERIHRNNFLIS